MINNLFVSYAASFFKIILFFVVLYAGLCLLLFIFQKNLIYFPGKKDFSDCAGFQGSELINYNSVRGYFTAKNKDKVVVFYHGNAGRACDRGYLNKLFLDKEYSTFFVEYSGYAEENNSPSKKLILQNVDDVIIFLNTKGFKNIVVVSESIGTGPATYHAYKSNVSKLILITPFNNLIDVAQAHYPIFPAKLLLTENFTPDKWIENYSGPVSFIFAENDEIMTGGVGQKLFEASHSTLKITHTVLSSGHNSIYESEDFKAFLKNELP